MSELFPRYLQSKLEESLKESPVILLCGPRQCGKTTLVRDQLQTGHVYMTFDDPVLQEAAVADPVGFVRRLPETCILDEIQHAPGILGVLKQEVDRNRTPGRFILTGSAQVLLLPTIADSLAGRIAMLNLFPLAQCEIEGKRSTFLERVFHDQMEGLASFEPIGQVEHRVLTGGFPESVLRESEASRIRWFRNYLTALLQKDVRDLGRVDHVEVLPRLMELLATRTAQLLNSSELASSFQLGRTTIDRYFGLLKQLFLVDTLQPWYVNTGKRLVKRPKVHVLDTGLTSAILNVRKANLLSERKWYGQLLESFVLNELKRMASWQAEAFTFFHYRTGSQKEVDIIVRDEGSHFVAIEVKASMTVTHKDFNGIQDFRSDVGSQFAAGIILYEGDHAVPFGDGLMALPVSTLWTA